MYLEIFPADSTVFRVFWGISRDFAEIPEFRGSATARNIRSPVMSIIYYSKIIKWDLINPVITVHLTTSRIERRTLSKNLAITE